MRSFRAGCPRDFCSSRLFCCRPPPERRSPEPAPLRLPLTVDSIMRGPDLCRVGRTLSSAGRETRRRSISPGEAGDKADSCMPSAGTDWPAPPLRRRGQARAPGCRPMGRGAPEAARDRGRGRRHLRWPASSAPSSPAHRRRVERTLGAERHPCTTSRWQPLHRPGAAGSSAVVRQITDVSARRAEPRLTDSQSHPRGEEKLIAYLREQKERKARAEEKAKATKLPAGRLQERQSAADLMLSPDGTHVLHPGGRAPSRGEETIGAEYVTESGYRGHPGPHQCRRHPGTAAAGDPRPRHRQDRLGRRQFRAAGCRRRRRHAGDAEGGETPRPGRVRIGKSVVDAVVSSDAGVGGDSAVGRHKDRWSFTLDADSGRTTVIDALQDEAWVRDAAGGSAPRLPARSAPHRVPRGARRVDAPLHPGRVDRGCHTQAADVGQMGGALRRSLTRRLPFLPDHQRGPSWRAAGVHAAGGRRQPDAADDHGRGE